MDLVEIQKVPKEKFLDAQNPKHVAISLNGEPTLYNQLSEYIDYVTPWNDYDASHQWDIAKSNRKVRHTTYGCTFRLMLKQGSIR